MFRIILLIIFIFSLNKIAIAKDNEFLVDDLFHIDQMNSHNKNFALYFKGREKSILARGETSNYINDFPKDLYIYDYKTKTSSPLISYDWFPSQAKYYLEEYDFPVFSSSVRLENAAGEWYLEKIDDSSTKVTYTWNGALEGSFPSYALTRAWNTQGNEMIIWLKESLEEIYKD